MPVSVRKFDKVVFIGELSHKKDWLGNLADDDQKMTFLSIVKEIFDNKIYNGKRCEAENCQGKTCPKEREMNIVILKESETQGVITRVVMLDAYKKPDAEDQVFHVKYTSEGEPIRYIIRVHTFDSNGEKLSIGCEGFIRQVVDSLQCEDTRKLMKESLEDEERTLDVFALMTENYKDNAQCLVDL